MRERVKFREKVRAREKNMFREMVTVRKELGFGVNDLVRVKGMVRVRSW